MVLVLVSFRAVQPLTRLYGELRQLMFSSGEASQETSGALRGSLALLRCSLGVPKVPSEHPLARLPITFWVLGFEPLFFASILGRPSDPTWWILGGGGEVPEV